MAALKACFSLFSPVLLIFALKILGTGFALTWSTNDLISPGD